MRFTYSRGAANVNTSEPACCIVCGRPQIRPDRELRRMIISLAALESSEMNDKSLRRSPCVRSSSCVVRTLGLARTTHVTTHFRRVSARSATSDLNGIFGGSCEIARDRARSCWIVLDRAGSCWIVRRPPSRSRVARQRCVCLAVVVSRQRRTATCSNPAL